MLARLKAERQVEQQQAGSSSGGSAGSALRAPGWQARDAEAEGILRALELQEVVVVGGGLQGAGAGMLQRKDEGEEEGWQARQRTGPAQPASRPQQAAAPTPAAHAAAAAPAAASDPVPTLAALLAQQPSLPEEVQRLRDQAKQAHQAGDYERSAELYTRAIALQPDAAVLYTNRAIAHLKLRQWHAALEDSSIAAYLEPGNAKAHYNRATAREALGDLQVGGAA